MDFSEPGCCRCAPERSEDVVTENPGGLTDYEFLRLLMGSPAAAVQPGDEGSIADSIEDAVNKAARAAGIALSALQVAAIVARILQAVLEAIGAAPQPGARV